MKPLQRAGRVSALRLREQLSDREISVLSDVERFRYLTARQIEELHFFAHATVLTGARTCRRVLERLTNLGALFRLERRIGGIRAGSASFVYTLGAMGSRILHGDSGVRVRRREPSEQFLDHTLAVAQVAVDLYGEQRSGRIESLSIETEPTCWRTFTSGLEGPETLKPDLAVSLVADDYEYHWFVEVDCATHSAPAVIRKCRIYHRCWASGIEQTRRGLFPKVLFITPCERRAALLRRAIETTPHLHAELFQVVTSDDALAALTGGAS